MIKLATVFSGVGAIEHALKKMNIKYKSVFACDNGERHIDLSPQQEDEIISIGNNKARKVIVDTIYASTKKENYVKQSFMANYSIGEENWFEDIRFINGFEFREKIDLFVGGSPCQSFSVIGKRSGIDDQRGILVFEFIRLVSEIQPKVFIYENVKGILSHDRRQTWEIIKEKFKNLGYKIYVSVLNSKDYGIPQNRQRVFVIGFKDNNIDFSFPKPIKLEVTAAAFLERNHIDPKHYLGKKGFEFVTNIKYRNRAKINQEVVQTQKANQQYNWNGDFRFEALDEGIHSVDILKRANQGEWNGIKGVIRQLTPRECFSLMGYDESFKIVVPSTQAYRQAGNSIVVNVLEFIMHEIIKVVDLNEKN